MSGHTFYLIKDQEMLIGESRIEWVFVHQSSIIFYDSYPIQGWDLT